MSTINDWEAYKKAYEDRIAMLEFELEKAQAIVDSCTSQISIKQQEVR